MSGGAFVLVLIGVAWAVAQLFRIIDVIERG